MITHEEKIIQLAKRLREEYRPLNTPETVEFWLETCRYDLPTLKEIYSLAGYEPLQGWPLKRV